MTAIPANPAIQAHFCPICKARLAKRLVQMDTTLLMVLLYVNGVDGDVCPVTTQEHALSVLIAISMEEFVKLNVLLAIMVASVFLVRLASLHAMTVSMLQIVNFVSQDISSI